MRFYLAKWISAPRIIYLDTDVIVKGDVCELFDLALQKPHVKAQVVLRAIFQSDRS